LSNTPKSFLSVILLVPHVFCLELWFSYLCLPHRWAGRHIQPCSAYSLRWGLANVLLRLASNHNLPDLCLPNSWDYRCALQILFYICSVIAQKKGIREGLCFMERFKKNNLHLQCRWKKKAQCYFRINLESSYACWWILECKLLTK
jgi:hypothetical protein